MFQSSKTDLFLSNPNKSYLCHLTTFDPGALWLDMLGSADKNSLWLANPFAKVTRRFFSSLPLPLQGLLSPVFRYPPHTHTPNSPVLVGHYRTPLPLLIKRGPYEGKWLGTGLQVFFFANLPILHLNPFTNHTHKKKRRKRKPHRCLCIVVPFPF